MELIDENGNAYGLRHIANIWRKTELGLNMSDAVCEALADKRITGIRYITQKGKYMLKTDLLLAVNFDALEDVLTLPQSIVNIEDEAFYGIAANAIDIPASEVSQSIGSGVFAGIPQPFYVRIPSSVTEIADDAFDDGEITIFCERDSAAYNYLSGKTNLLWRNTQKD